MHAKVTVADDVVFVGSFNLSHSGEQNAENVLEIADAQMADRLAAFVESVAARYPRFALKPGRGARGRLRGQGRKRQPVGVQHAARRLRIARSDQEDACAPLELPVPPATGIAVTPPLRMVIGPCEDERAAGEVRDAVEARALRARVRRHAPVGADAHALRHPELRRPG